MELFHRVTLGLNEMKIQFTGKVEKSVPYFHLEVSNTLSKFLTGYLDGRTYGDIDQVTFIAVALDEDLTDIEARCVRLTKFTSITHPFSKEKIKTLVVALPFTAAELVAMSMSTMNGAYCESMLKRLETIRVKIPKNVDYLHLVTDLVDAIISAK